MKVQGASHDKKRLFYSDLKNDNPLDCIVSKVRVAQVPPCVCINSTFSYVVNIYKSFHYLVYVYLFIFLLLYFFFMIHIF